MIENPSNFIVAVPARYASTRLPGKPLAEVGGMAMIKRVCLQAKRSTAMQIIACVDDQRVRDALKGIDVTVCMTSMQCKCGTDRIAEMINTLSIDPETIIVNVQGDEPLINPEHIDAVAHTLISSNADMSTLCAKIDNIQDVFDPNCVKVVFDKNGKALYFSRNPIPYERGNFDKNNATITELKFSHYHHIGIYAYKAKTVLMYSSMEQPDIECCESLEQLRLLYNGMTIAVAVTDRPPEIGVDTKEDLIRVNKLLCSNNLL